MTGLAWALTAGWMVLTETATPPGALELQAYGSLRVHLAAYNRDFEVQDGASRLGLRPAWEWRGVRLLGHAEWGMNLVDANVRFNVDGNAPAEDQVTLAPAVDGEVLTTRLGYVGVAFEPLGRLTVGKQWSVVYDVAGWTDRFWVFGGQGLGVYNAGTDGGLTGTGRADKAVVYRQEAERWSGGLQVQFQGDQAEDVIDSFGASLVRSLDESFQVGVAYNQTFYPRVLNDQNIAGLDGPEGRLLVAGTRYETEALSIAAAVARTWRYEFVVPQNAPVVYDTWGAEAFARYRVGRSVQLSLGFNLQVPVAPPTPIDPSFRILYGVVGGAYTFNPQTLVFGEVRIDGGRNVRGASRFNVAVVGLRVGFDANLYPGVHLRGPNEGAEKGSDSNGPQG